MDLPCMGPWVYPVIILSMDPLVYPVIIVCIDPSVYPIIIVCKDPSVYPIIIVCIDPSVYPVIIVCIDPSVYPVIIVCIDPWVYPVIIVSMNHYVYLAIISLRIIDILPFSQRIPRSELPAPVALRLLFVRYTLVSGSESSRVMLICNLEFNFIYLYKCICTTWLSIFFHYKLPVCWIGL